MLIEDALLAQLDRVTGYEPVGQGFESLAAHQIAEPSEVSGGFFVLANGKANGNFKVYIHCFAVKLEFSLFSE